MPAKLPYPDVKRDTSFWREDVLFLDAYLGPKNYTLTEIARELIHRYANEKRRALGLPLRAPHPPGTLP